MTDALRKAKSPSSRKNTWLTWNAYWPFPIHFAVVSCWTTGTLLKNKARKVLDCYIVKPAWLSFGHIYSWLCWCTNQRCHRLACDFLTRYGNRNSISCLTLYSSAVVLIRQPIRGKLTNRWSRIVYELWQPLIFVCLMINFRLITDHLNSNRLTVLKFRN